MSDVLFGSAQPIAEGQMIPGAHLALCLKPEALHIHELPLQARHRVFVLLNTRLLHDELARQPPQLFLLLPQLCLHPSSTCGLCTAQLLDNSTSLLSHTPCCKAQGRHAGTVPLSYGSESCGCI